MILPKQNKLINAEFKKIISESCEFSLEKDESGKYIDENTQYAWREYLNVNLHVLISACGTGHRCPVSTSDQDIAVQINRIKNLSH